MGGIALGATVVPIKPSDVLLDVAEDSRGRSPVQQLRHLAEQGTLATVAAAVPRAERTVLSGAAYEVAWPVVFTRLTRRVELRRGHGSCATSVQHLADECLDRFHDDVESVVEDILTRATKPIRHLEGWIASRLTVATVDGHRRRRGQRGALQRPRIPAWLADLLGHDRWLETLATDLLVWVGTTTTAGTGTWPVDAWVQRRAEMTGDWLGSDQAVVGREVARVLAAMRQRPDWYDTYVERPLGHKRTPVLPLSPGPAEPAERASLSLTEPYGSHDATLRELAATAVAWIDVRLRRGDAPEVAVVEVIGTIFDRGVASEDLDRPPHTTGYGVPVTTLLTDPRNVERIAGVALAILADDH